MKIVLTGGGTAGHVNPNIALIPALQKLGLDIIYIGSKNGIERRLLEPLPIKYYPISCGKLRRYFDLKNITDMTKFVTGTGEAAKILKKENAELVFSKGGFVGLPVVLGAKMHKIPVIIHESDYTPGLANKIAIPACKKVCVNFPETVEKIKNKAVLTGNPIRPSLFMGMKGKGLKICGLNGTKPVLLIIGGSQGSVKINGYVRDILGELLPSYDVIHICGKGNLSEDIKHTGYCQFEYVNEDLPNILAAADMVVSRAGANAITELSALKKPNLLIPLSKKASRGDQILNAESYRNQGYSLVLLEESLTCESLLAHINQLYTDRQLYIDNMNAKGSNNAVDEVIKVISEFIV